MNFPDLDEIVGLASSDYEREVVRAEIRPAWGTTWTGSTG